MDFTRLILDELKPLRRIGMGHCGSVWAGDARIDGSSSTEHTAQTTYCIKREDCGPGRSVLKEYRIHNTIMAALAAHPSLAVFILQNHCYLSASDAQWPSILPSFPPEFEACNAIINERIPPLPRRAQTELVRRYCPSRPGLQD